MNQYMEQAKEQALKGIRKQHGGPFGAVIVDEFGTVIACTNNRVLLSHDPTAHAEMEAIREASQKLKTHDLKNCTLYTSCEPCSMCLSAIIWANIKEVYYACTKEDAANIGFRDEKIYQYLKGEDNSLLTMHAMDREECLDIMKEYQKKHQQLY